MRTWEDFKNSAKERSPENRYELEQIEELAVIVSAMITRREALGMTQRELAVKCGIPQSSIARLESMKTTPNIETIIKVMQPLGLRLSVMEITQAQSQ